MSTIKPSLPQGTRDFGPWDMAKRNYIFSILTDVFRSFGFAEIQTPSMEQLTTLTGKYGDEGDQLIFKILNSGDFLSKTPRENLNSIPAKELLPLISERALRYDLTVPFARYVVMNQNDLSFPFKRFQIQPVWRADRPQKGRYREFFQCDADCIGSPSLVNEAELIAIYDRALVKLQIPDAVIKINNRKILAGIAEIAGQPERLGAMVVAIDKLDKIGAEGVNKELLEKGFSSKEIESISPFWSLGGNNIEQLKKLEVLLKHSETGLKGIEELKTVLHLLALDKKCKTKVEISLSLARGLNYYTGIIFEVSASKASGSIGGGGRYDDLTGIFGLKGVTGVGISFGADRIYDLMNDLNLFPAQVLTGPVVMMANFYEPAANQVYEFASRLRENGIDCLLYPDSSKLSKQLKHASKLGISYVFMVGESEYDEHKVLVKNMLTGDQHALDFEEALKNITVL